MILRAKVPFAFSAASAEQAASKLLPFQQTNKTNLMDIAHRILQCRQKNAVFKKFEEMPEWLKQHAWKAKRASGTERFRSTLTHTQSAT
jgi:hypothetical protein